MSEYKKEISAAVVVAIVIAAGLGAIAIYSFPGALTSTAVNSGVSTTTTASSMSLAVTTTTTGPPAFTTTGPPAFTTTSFTPAPWEPGQVVGLVLNSSVVQSFIGSAYSYDVVALGSSPSNPNLITVTVNVTGTQSVEGNWTTGYEVSYTGIRTLNATVQFAEPSSYTLQGVAVTVLPNVTQSITYDSNQQQVIRVALSNATGIIKGLMGTAAFYVASVTSVPIQNGTYAGDYFALINQVNSPNLVGVVVNGGMTAVVNAYTASRAETMCWTLGTPEGVPAPTNQVCFTSPWSSSS